MSLQPGDRLGDYQITNLLGAGGMGQVWSAEDVKLGRRVALKLLPEELTADPLRVSRFLQEARAASALNHPNVCTILTLGDAEGQYYIAMEYIEGETLRSRLATSRFSVSELLDIAIQMASALTAAHAAGIVHRDIKPENVMIRPDRFVKVLDFGLAKLVSSNVAVEAQSTQTGFRTDAGTIVGTLAYLSPEQARGQQVDVRTDIWALGCVLYEMVSGRSPFARPNSSDMLAAILERDPPPVARFEPDAPAELQRIIAKCLQKDRNQRYQTIQDLQLDVQALRHSMASALTRASDVLPTTSNLENAEQSIVPKSRWSGKAWLVAVIAAPVLAIISYALFWRVPAVTNNTSVAMASPLTSFQGFENVPSLSPDGSQVAFSWNGEAEDNYDIYIKLAGSGQPLRLTTDAAREDNPAWSPDGRLIAFQRYVTDTVADLVVIPALGGGAERKLRSVYRVASTRYQPSSMLAWTPDGRWIAFCGRPSASESNGIWLEAIDHAETRRLTESGTGAHEFFSPAFSPDGRRLAFVDEPTRFLGAIYVVPLSPALAPSASPTRVTTPASVLGLAWTPDGAGLVFSSGGHYGLSRLKRVTIGSGRLAQSGEPELLPFGEQATAITISTTGRLVYSAQFRDTNLSKVDLSSLQAGPVTKPVASSTYDENAPDYSPDGKRLAFASTRSGVEEIWVSNADGSNAKQVTFTGGPLCSNPRWSPDGRTILFNSRREGTSDLYLLRPDSGELTRLTEDSADDIEARWSRDGRWIYFASNRTTGQFDIWKMRQVEREPIRITRNGGFAATESPDRSFLYYAKDRSIWRVPIDGGEEKPVVDGLSYSTNFVVADRGLYFISVGDAPQKTSLEYFEYKTGKKATVLKIGKPFWFGMALSPDQRSILYSTIDSAGSNLMLVDTFR